MKVKKVKLPKSYFYIMTGEGDSIAHQTHTIVKGRRHDIERDRRTGIEKILGNLCEELLNNNNGVKK